MNILDIVIKLGEKYYFGRGKDHAFKVRDLALKIFDETRRLELHDMKSRERLWLEIAAILHDIGVYIGEEHNKYSRKLILSSNKLKEVLNPLDIEAIGWIAFFHRKRPNPLTCKSPEWKKFETNKDTVVRLVAILRIADALDRSLTQIVDNVEIEKRNNKILIKVYSNKDVSIEVERACEKAQLFQKIFKVKVEIKQI